MRRKEDMDALDIVERINSSIKSELSPMMNRIDSLAEKVTELYRDRVTRSDIEKISLSFVPRDTYEARHAQLIERDKNFEDDLRAHRQETTDRIVHLSSVIQETEKKFDEKMNKQQQIELSSQDRMWLRFTQIIGLLGLLGPLIYFLLMHVVIK